jgi:hypothetical protein
MAEDINYTEYPSYKPYVDYATYASAKDEASAKQDMAKRHEMMIDESMMAKDNTKREMTTTDSIGTPGCLCQHDFTLTHRIACNVKYTDPDGVVACWKRNEMQAPETGKTEAAYGSYE